MENISSKVVAKVSRPVKVLQFGEGNFLRAFVDWIIDEMNKKADFNAGVAVVQPMPFGRCKELKEADEALQEEIDALKKIVYYGGAALAGVSLLLFIFVIALFAKTGKLNKKLNKLNKEDDEDEPEEEIDEEDED